MSMLLLQLADDSNGPAFRGTVADDGEEVYSVYDCMTRGCDYKASEGASQTTPCMTIVGLTSFMGYLGNKVGAQFREILNNTFRQVMGGDRKLIEVINANSISDSPIQRAFQASLVKDPVPPVLEELCLKKKRDREDLMFDMEMAERRARLQEGQLRMEDSKLALDERKLRHAASLIEHANKTLREWTGVDERFKLQVEDGIKNVLFSTMAATSSQPLAITDGAQPAPTAPVNETAGLSVSILAKELGHKCTEGDLQRIGRAMAKKYREAYKREPSKHTQYVGGSCIPVNSYMERDRAMMEQVIHTAMKPK